MDKNNKTQSDLIIDLGINKSTISTWYNGTKMPRMGTIQTLADYFGIMKSDLIEEKDNAPTIGEGSLDAEQQQAMDLLESLPADKKAEALRYLEYLASQKDNQ